MSTPPIILDLCGGSGAWSAPYREAGYDVRNIDPVAGGPDVRLLTAPKKSERAHGILAAPPCQAFALCGARWWEEKGDEAIVKGMAVVDACLRVIWVHRPAFWALENPVGRLKHWLGEPRMRFDPCEFGGWLSPEGDAYTKRTCLWGEFNRPERRPVEPVEGSKMHKMGESAGRAAARSLTPEGFARAFFAANP